MVSSIILKQIEKFTSLNCCRVKSLLSEVPKALWTLAEIDIGKEIGETREFSYKNFNITFTAVFVSFE